MSLIIFPVIAAKREKNSPLQGVHMRVLFTLLSAAMLPLCGYADGSAASYPDRHTGCHCQNCICTPEAHCGCLSQAGCGNIPGSGCECAGARAIRPNLPGNVPDDGKRYRNPGQ